jgi:hypothetical protein
LKSLSMEKLNICLGIVIDIIAGFGCIKVYAEWMTFQLMPTLKRARLEVKDHLYTFHRNICSGITKWLYIFFLHIAIFLTGSAEHKLYILTS